MLTRPQAHTCRRPANIAPFVAVCMIPIVGMAAIVIDIGLLRDEQQQAVTAADAAALAGATEMFKSYIVYGGKDHNNAAVDSALTTAAANGFPQNGPNSNVIVNVWPDNYQGGPRAGTQVPPGYIEVIITFKLNRGFSLIWGDDQLKGGARAVGRGRYSPVAPGILVLDPTDPNSLSVTASGGVTVTNGGSIIVDSTSGSGASLSNTGNVTASDINLSGPSYSASNTGTMIGTVNYNVPRTPDPLAALTEPSVPSLPVLPATTLSTLGSNYSTTNGVNYSGSANIDLYPGYYGGIKLSGTGSAILHDNADGSPGIYYIGSQGFSVTNAGGISGSNVMIYSAGTGSISLTGTGSVTLSPPTSGIYKGISVFQERSSTKQISITAQGNFNVTGTFYAAAAKVSVTAQGDYTNYIGSQWIAYQLAVTGSGNFTVNYNGKATPIRMIQLVE
jgi:hypothetical protein